MGFIDKAKEFAGKNPDKVDQGVDKAGDFINQKTGGGHEDQVGKAGEFAKGKLHGDGGAPAEGEQPPA